MVRGILEIFELTHIAPLGNRADVDIQQSRGGTGGVSPIPPWLVWRERLGPWQGVMPAEPWHVRGGKRSPQARRVPRVMQHEGDLLIGVAHGECPDAGEDGGGRPADGPRPPGTGDRERRPGRGLPSNRPMNGRGASGEGDIFHEDAPQWFALARRGGRRGPDGGQVAGQVDNLLALLRAEGPGTWPRHRGRVALEPLDLGPLPMPLPLQAPGHEPVFGVDGQEPAAGEVRFLLRPRQATVPLRLNLACLGFPPLQGRQGAVQLGGLHGSKKCPSDGGVHAITAQGLAGRRRAIAMRPGTGIERGRPLLQGADAHPPPARAAEDHPLEEGRPRADGTPGLRGAAGTVVRHAGLVPQAVLPRERGRVDVVEENGPGLGGAAARVAFEPWGLARPQAEPGGGPTVDVGARIRRVMEDGEHPRVASRFPEDLPMALFAPQAVREAQAGRGDMLDHREGRPLLREAGKDQVASGLDRLIGIEHALAGRIEDEPDRGTKAALALFGFLALAPCEATAQPVAFRVAHGALKA
jgi:hypothetical protein